MPTTLGAWARREAVLLCFLALAAAAAALGRALDARWLYVAALVVAALGALARLAIAIVKARLEEKHERAALDRRTRVPIRDISLIDPTQVGVDPAAQGIIPGENVPDYWRRRVDKALRAAVRAALDGTGPWLVVAVGTAKVGKSRTLFEALSYCAQDHPLDFVAPVDGNALRSLLAPGERWSETRRSVLWLDDLEPFLNQDVTLQTLRDWHENAPGSLVAATYGGRGSDLLAEAGSGPLTTLAGDVLQHACEVYLRPTTLDELEPLRHQVAPEVFEDLVEHGLAAYLVAAPALRRKLETSRHVARQLVNAAIDWARCGRTDPIVKDVLNGLWLSYLDSSGVPPGEDFDANIAWALEPVAGTIALIQQQGVGFRAYDYVIRSVSGDSEAPPPQDAAWTSAISGVTEGQAMAVGTSAYLYRRYEFAATAFGVASRSPSDELAAVAGVNLGRALLELERFADALDANDKVMARVGEAPELALCEAVAEAMVNKGVALVGLRRAKDALDVYDNVVARFGNARELALREAVAGAMVNKGVALRMLGRSKEALESNEEVLARFGDAPEPALREEVERARVNKGVLLAKPRTPAEVPTEHRPRRERVGLQGVAVGSKSLADYTHIVGRPLVEEIRELSADLAGLKVLHLSATPFGGGVSEILYTLVPLMLDVGIEAEWQVMLGREEFYNATKRMHNALQGNPADLTEEEVAIYERYNELNAKEVSGGWDVIIVHDPQPALIHHHVPEKAGIWVWRCHIDLSTPNPQSIERLVPYVSKYDTAVFHMDQYVPAGLRKGTPIQIVPPAIDPLSPKNMALSPEDAAFVCDQFGVDVNRPLICQVSRFDPWNDPLGVIDAYRLVHEEMPDVQLALVGSVATDDPEGWEFFNSTIEYAAGDPDIKILNQLNNVGGIEINAFQSLADVILQKSVRAGFGRAVTEALWKARPTVAADVGGIRQQIADGETGFLFDSVETAATRCIQVLRDAELGNKLGRASRERVRERFLTPRLLRDWLRILGGFDT